MPNTPAFLKCAALIALLAFTPAFAQSTTQSTTLSAAVPAPSISTPASLYNTVYVASTSNMYSAAFNGQSSTAQTYLYVDREVIPVVSVVNSTTLTVFRGSTVGGVFGTLPAGHVSGATVLFGPAANFVQGQHLIQAEFTSNDPSGSCISTNYWYLPLINAQNGHLINCDSIASSSQVWALAGQSAFVNAVGCGWKATTTSVTDSGMVTLAAGNVIRQLATSGTGGTTEVTCPVTPSSVGLSNGKGILVTSVSLLYGVQGSGGLYTGTTAPVLDSITYAAPGATAAGAIGTTACGTLTQTPASLVTTVTSSGVYNTVNEACGTPFYATANKFLVADFTFANTTTALTYQLPGLIVYYDQPL